VNNSELQWLTQAQQGDMEAFACLVDLYQRPVFNLCYRMLGEPTDAEDAAQETFLRAFTNIQRYDRDRPFSTWLLSIAAHYCIDQIRRRRVSFYSIDAEDEDGFTLELPDLGPGPETVVSQLEDQRRIQRLLKKLGPHDRAAVVMLYWYDMSYEEIASTLGLTVSAVKSRLHRARLELADYWREPPPQNIPVERMRHDEIRTPAL
jgi:RNA polymerase sigma-70 factor (ECF subfamily)